MRNLFIICAKSVHKLLFSVKIEFAANRDGKPYIYNNSENGAFNDISNLNDIDVTTSFMGVRSTTWEEFVTLYQKHASYIDFSFNKSTTRRENDKIIEKYFV